MPQTQVQKQDAVRFGSGVLEFNSGSGFVNIGMVANVAMVMTKLVTEFQGDNAKMDPVAKPQETFFNFDLYEIDLTFLELINGDFALTNTPATPVSITTEALGTGWTIGQPIKLVNKNGDNSEVANIVIDAAATPLVLNTDYNVYVGDGENGDLGFTYIVPVTTQAGVLDADYDYTPNASKTGKWGDIRQALNLNEFRFVQTDAAGKTLTINFYQAYNIEGISIDFQGDEDEDPASMPVSIKVFPDSTKGSTENLFEIVDERSVT